ncbi:RND superfamily putative drug exporter [Nocardioides albertanoniae]|uniref:RND superfamily putative drug exporter n=1 Tax=Nocardioides albertanoniae TaxID=1175486 RepID=A0A543ABB0_9ACTN|nr:MMPL family transporter [Nocardioides albertanoniae]TQL69756.1 RND superfamily putative drug exporter [Nocardioides albertanoniae]
MAELLYRLGKTAARRAWLVILAWVLALSGAAGAYVAWSGELTTSFDIPGLPSSDVVDELQKGLPDLAGGSGTIVYQTEDGSPLSAAQKKEIRAQIASAKDLPDVATVTDPFQTETQREAQATKVTEGQAKIEAGQKQLSAAQAKLDKAQAGIDKARTQALAAGMPTTQIDAQQAKLDKQQAKLDENAADLEANAKKAENGAELLELSDGIRMVSEDGSAAMVNVAYSVGRLDMSEETKKATVDHFADAPVDGVEVGVSSDISQEVPNPMGPGEIVGVGVAAIVLLVMLGTIIGAGVPLVTALTGVGIGALGALSLSGVVQMASMTPILGLMLGLAVGIDYSLFILNRHRKQLLHGSDVTESIALATGTAGTAVVFAGSTVIVALVALNMTGIPFLGLMGSVGAACVAIAVLVAITLTPAILSLVGGRIVSKRARAKVTEHDAAEASARPMPTWRALVTVVASVVALLALAIPALDMRLGLPDGGSEPEGSLARTAYTITEDSFGAGANGPLLVAADLPAGLSEGGIQQAQLSVAQTLAELDDVRAVAPAAVSEDGRTAAFQVVPEEGPNSVSTNKLVGEIRDLPPVNGTIDLGVAGAAAVAIDVSQGLNDVLLPYLGVVVGLSLLILILVFRSILVPLIATGGFVLSLLATYGVVVAVFQKGIGAEWIGLDSTGPILSFLPILLVGILFGLAMDYQLFLASGMREAYVHGDPARVAVAHGLRAGRSVVIAAGLIMVSVFGGFIFAESAMIRSMGFGLALGVLLDAFIVRMLLMPALMHLLGRSAWWLPKWLDRILPNVDVEGAALERAHGAEAPSEATVKREKVGV